MRRFPLVLAACAALAGCAGADRPAAPAAPAPVAGTPVSPFIARGNEPGWRLDIGGDRMTFVGQDGRRVAAAVPAAQRTDAFTRYARSFGFRDDGALVLAAGDGRTILARR